MAFLLECVKVTQNFGGLRALQNVSLEISPGEIIGLIGPNGAGKTTLVNVVTGAYVPTEGRINFKGRKIDGVKPHLICKMGIARTFQAVQTFRKMSVVENVAAGILFARGVKKVDAAKRLAIESLDFVGLADYAAILSSQLTLAQRQRLEMAKALAMNPSLLFLDEVNAGLNPTEIEAALKLIKTVAERGITIVLIEHLMKVVMSLCSRIIVLHHGQILSQGAPQSVVKESKVIEAYLGRRYAKESSH